jgi:murein DD-endopeptidase MepM/ murein hydrolase activator NlpD
MFVISFLLSAIALCGAESTYTVKEGDTFFALARKAGVSADALATYNAIPDPSKLKVGTVLRIPGVYLVQKGDTLYGIARSHSVSVDDLLAANKLTKTSKIKPGDELVLPKGSVETAAASPPATTTAVSTPVASAAGAGPRAPAGFVWPHPGRFETEKGKLWWLVFQGAAGDVVRSAAAGEVKWAATWVGFGKVLIIQGADGINYQYRGNRELLVNVGDRVQPGTEIAKLGPSLLGGGTRLYFSINDAKGNAVDPEKFFSAKSQS